MKSSPATGARGLTAALAALASALTLAQSPGPAPPPAPSPPVESSEDLLYDKFDRARFNNGFSSHYYYTVPDSAEARLVYFPPVPPPLDADLRLLPPLAAGPAAPAELEAFAGDLFYPLLAERLASDDLPKALRAELEAYRGAKADLQAELRARLDQLKDAEPAARERELAALATRQTPRISALENTAEKLRGDLQPTGLFGLPRDANPAQGIVAREARGAEARPPWDDWRRQARAVRLAAYFDKGFSPAQRRLLGEVALDLDARADREAGSPAASAADRMLDFSPECARIPLLDNPPAALADKLGDFAARRTRLKAELLDALRQNSDASAGERADALRRLAGRQEPEFAALEALAEDIRRDLAALPDPPGPPAPPALPAELAARIAAYRTHKVELLRTLYTMITRVPDKPAPHPAKGNATTGAPADGGMPWLRDGGESTAVKPENLRVSPEEFNRRQNELVGELNQELAGIRASLSEYVRTTHRPADRKSINDLLNDFEVARQKQEIWDKYRDYQAAALQPGLSPEQRRLLFAAAIEKLALPLPPAERVD